MELFESYSCKTDGTESTIYGTGGTDYTSKINHSSSTMISQPTQTVKRTILVTTSDMETEELAIEKTNAEGSYLTMSKSPPLFSPIRTVPTTTSGQLLNVSPSNQRSSEAKVESTNNQSSESLQKLLQMSGGNSFESQENQTTEQKQPSATPRKKGAQQRF